MKIGDLVLTRSAYDITLKNREVAVVVSEIRRGFNASFVDILLKGKVCSANIRALKVINESR